MLSALHVVAVDPTGLKIGEIAVLVPFCSQSRRAITMTLSSLGSVSSSIFASAII